MAPNDSWPDAQNDSPTPVAKKKMSGCMLAGLIVGGLGLVGMVVCCGGFAWLGATFAPTISNSPAEVAVASKKILNIEVLDGFVADKAITMDNMVFTMRIAEYNYTGGKGKMMIGSMNLKIGDPRQGKMQSAQFRSNFENETRGSLDIKKSESHEVTINGQKVSVSIGEAVERGTNKAVHTLNADFEPTFILLNMDDDVWDQDAVLKMLENAKPPE